MTTSNGSLSSWFQGLEQVTGSEQTVPGRLWKKHLHAAPDASLMAGIEWVPGIALTKGGGLVTAAAGHMLHHPPRVQLGGWSVSVIDCQQATLGLLYTQHGSLGVAYCRLIPRC